MENSDQLYILGKFIDDVWTPGTRPIGFFSSRESLVSTLNLMGQLGWSPTQGDYEVFLTTQRVLLDLSNKAELGKVDEDEFPKEYYAWTIEGLVANPILIPPDASAYPFDTCYDESSLKGFLDVDAYDLVLRISRLALPRSRRNI